MNIFVLDDDPQRAARAHCDKHVVKMILETAQIMSTVYFRYGYDTQYKPTHMKHPCTLWAGDCTGNYAWLVKLGCALCREYTYRYGKTHKSQRIIEKLSAAPIGMPHKRRQPFAQCMPDEYKRPDAVDAYRAYYLGDKVRMLSYRARPAPHFVSASIGL